MYSLRNKKEGFNLTDIIIVTLVIIAVFNIFKEEEIVYGEGVQVLDTPIQGKVFDDKTFNFKNFKFEKLVSYNIRARVLSRKDYSDYGSILSPTDLALGWGNMSDEKILKQMDIWQSGRWYRYKWGRKGVSISPNEIIRSSANTHIIPANKIVENKLKKVVKGSIIEMKGYLVKITGENNFSWTSSLTRKDTGNGACEVFYVEELNL